MRQRLGSWDDEAGAAGKVTGDRGGGKARQKGRFEMRKVGALTAQIKDRRE